MPRSFWPSGPLYSAAHLPSARLGDDGLAVLKEQDPELLGDAAALAAEAEAEAGALDVAAGIDLRELLRVVDDHVHRGRRPGQAGLGQHVGVVVQSGSAVEDRHAPDLVLVGRVIDDGLHERAALDERLQIVGRRRDQVLVDEPGEEVRGSHDDVTGGLRRQRGRELLLEAAEVRAEDREVDVRMEGLVRRSGLRVDRIELGIAAPHVQRHGSVAARVCDGGGRGARSGGRRRAGRRSARSGRGRRRGVSAGADDDRDRRDGAEWLEPPGVGRHAAPPPPGQQPHR